MVPSYFQEKRSHSGLGRRQEEVKQDNEPGGNENTSAHDAKKTRATWRKYVKSIMLYYNHHFHTS